MLPRNGLILHTALATSIIIYIKLMEIILIGLTHSNRYIDIGGKSSRCLATAFKILTSLAIGYALINVLFSPQKRNMSSIGNEELV